MKLKFEKEVSDILNLISQLPDTATETIDLKKPRKIISNFYDTLLQQQIDKSIPSKHWAVLRRQLSFLYELIDISRQKVEKLQKSKSVLENEYEFLMRKINNTNRNKVYEYELLVKTIKDITTGKILQNSIFILIAIRYGIVQLSKYEIEILIDNNNNNNIDIIKYVS